MSVVHGMGRRSPLADARAEAAFLGGLLDAVGDVSALAAPLARLNDVMRGSNTTISMLGDESIYVPSHIPSSVVAEYLPRIEEDPWFQAPVRRRGVTHALGTMLVPQREYRRSRVYSDLNRRVGTEYAVFSGQLDAWPQLIFVANRGPHQRDFGAQDLARMRRLYPAVVRFAHLHLLHMRAQRPQPGAGRVDLACDGRADADAVAAALLDARPGLWIDGIGPALAHVDAAAFRQAVAACSRGELPRQARYTLGEGEARLGLQVGPVRRGDGAGWIARIELVANPARERPSLAFLTPAERRLLAALVAGSTLREHAERGRRSMNTVRSQLKSLLAKTGCRRQVDLVRRFAHAAGP